MKGLAISMVVLGVIAAVAIPAWLLYCDPLPFDKSPAYCMCSAGVDALPHPEDHQEFDDYITSQQFILTILRRDPKYAPLIPEARNFWNPRLVKGHINNHVLTNFDASYQQLFLDL